ncbi:MAG: 50S ribosomal protein L29 [Chlamydiales bacterium]|nr:50S ribosomal protein L29 [Chlamydiales bacterium]
MSNMEELRSLSEEDLKQKYNELSKEIFGLTNELRITRKLEKPHLIRETKRNRARIMTVLNEKQGVSNG